jgi:hypothetical protein
MNFERGHCQREVELEERAAAGRQKESAWSKLKEMKNEF